MYDDILGEQQKQPYEQSKIEIDRNLLEELRSTLKETYVENLELKSQVEDFENVVEVQRKEMCKISRELSRILLHEDPITFIKAREFMCNAFVDDPDLLRVYTDNVAMLLYDEQDWAKGGLDFKDKSTRDRIAGNIMGFIFGASKQQTVKSPGLGVVEVDT